MNEGDALAEGVVVTDDRCLGDTDRCVLVLRLDDEREAQVARPLRGSTARADHEVGDADALVREHFLRQSLVARQHQPLGRRARVGQAQHLEHGGDRVVEPRLAREPLRQIEDDVGGFRAQARRQEIDAVAKPEQAHLVTLRDQSARDVELGLVTRLDLLLPVLRRGRLTVRIEENEHAKGFLHSPTLILDRNIF